MTAAGSEMSFRRLLAWQLRIAWASLFRGKRQGTLHRLFFFGLGAFWLAAIGFGVHAALDESLRRTQGGEWLGAFLLQTVWLGTLAMTLFFNIGFLLHIIFFSGDLPHLMAAPVHPRKILTLRFLAAMWANAFFCLFLSLPTTVAVGLRLHAGWLYYATYLVAFVCFLGIPVSLTYFIGIPLARWVSTSRIRAVFSILSFVLALSLWTLPYLAPGRVTSYRQWNLLMAGTRASLDFFGSPLAQLLPSSWAAGALVEALAGHGTGALLRLLGLATVTLGASALAITLGARSYLDGWIRMVPVGETRVARSERFTFLLGWLPHRWRPIFWKDLSVVSRDFRVSFQLYSLGVLMCLFPFVTLLSQNAPIPEAMKPLVAFSSAIGAAVVVSSQAGMMTIPLEGRAGFRLLAAPLTPLEVAATKWLVAVLLSLPVVIAQMAIISLGFRQPLGVALTGGILALAAGLLGAGFGIFMGASFANFAWDHPRRMVRPGAQIGWGFGVGTIVALLAVVVQVGMFVDERVSLGRLGALAPILALAAASLVSVAGISLAARKLARLEWM